MDINLKVTEETVNELTWEQWEVFTSGEANFNFRAARDVIAMFVVDASGKAVPHTEAFTLLGKLKTKEIMGIIEKLGAGLGTYKAGIINPQSGGA